MGPNPNGPSSVSCETELLDTQVFSGSVKSGSCLGFLGFLCVVFFFRTKKQKDMEKNVSIPHSQIFVLGWSKPSLHPPPHSKKQQKDSKIKQDIGFIPLRFRPLWDFWMSLILRHQGWFWRVTDCQDEVWSLPFHSSHGKPYIWAPLKK